MNLSAFNLCSVFGCVYPITHDSLVLCKNLFLLLSYFFIQAKVHPYWPQKSSSKVERFIIEMNSDLTFGDYVVRELKVTNTEVQMNFNFILL